MKQSFFPNYSKSIWLKLALVYLLNFNGINQSFSQPSTLYTTLTSTSPATTNSRLAVSSIGGFRQVRFQATSSASSGANWAFHTGTMASPNTTLNYRPVSANQTISFNSFVPTSSSSGARYNTGGGGYNGLLPNITGGNYYTFNVSANNGADNVMSVLETSYNPSSISTVTQFPLISAVDNLQAVTVRISLPSLPNFGEAF